MSVQRRLQETKQVNIQNPRSKTRDQSGWTPQQKYDHMVATRSDPRTREGLIELGYVWVGPKLSLTNSERERFGFPILGIRVGEEEGLPSLEELRRVERTIKESRKKPRKK